MQRIAIFGNGGSGKSTLARKLGAHFDLPVIHLDALFWQPGWVEPDDADFRARVADALSSDRWVTDGNFVRVTAGLRLPQADLAIFIRQPGWLCLQRAIWRWLSNQGRRRTDLADGCDENFDWDFVKWIWRFERVTAPRIEAILAASSAPVVTLAGDRAIARYLAGLV